MNHLRKPPEIDLPLAFGILVHRQVGLFELFMASSYKPGDSVCVHVDTKSEPEVKQVKKCIFFC